jgi:hypothetical protein
MNSGNAKTRDKMALMLLLALLGCLLTSAVAPSVMGDRGGFSPRRVQVTETAQKAIIAWNGTYEALILSTDVSSTNESEVVEIMPLPSNPTISKGETRSFGEVTALVNSFFDATINRRYYYYFRYGMLYVQSEGFGLKDTQSISITFQETIGFHFLTVVKAEDSRDLMQWLDDFLENRGYNSELPSGLEELVAKYIRDETKYFVIDVIKTNSTVQTVDPLIYQFQTSKLYYPLRISSLFSGATSISLFTITTNEMKKDSVFGGQFGIGAQFQIEKETSTRVCANFTGLFSANPYLYYLSFNGPQQNFSEDIAAEFQSSSDTSTLAAASVSLAFGLTLLLLFLAPKIDSLLDLQVPANKRLQIAFLLTGLVGIGLVWAGFVLPWGLTAFGQVLLPADGTSATSQSSMSLLYVLLLLGAIPCYTYLLLISGDSKMAATHFTVTGAGTLTVSLITGGVALRTVSTGMYLTIAGCAFIALAGFLSLRRLQSEPVARHKMTNFKTYVARRFLISVLTMFAVLVFIFWLISLLPPYSRILPY